MLLTVQYYTTACERSTQTQTRREEKRIKCVINCSMLLSTVHGRRRRTVFVQIYCEILSPFRLTRRSPRLTRQQLPTAERAVCREGRYFCRATVVGRGLYAYYTGRVELLSPLTRRVWTYCHQQSVELMAPVEDPAVWDTLGGVTSLARTPWTRVTPNFWVTMPTTTPSFGTICNSSPIYA